jgi:hypothetical protein
VEKASLERPRAFARRGNSTGWGLEGREGSEGGSGLLRVDGGRHLVGSRSSRAARRGVVGGGPRSAERMPGTTHSRRSSDDDEGVEAALVRGDREGRARSSPPGLDPKHEPARARASAAGPITWAEELHRCAADRRETGGSRAGAGRPEREAGGPRGFGDRAAAYARRALSERVTPRGAGRNTAGMERALCAEGR